MATSITRSSIILGGSLLFLAFMVTSPVLAQCLDCATSSVECEEKTSGWCECTVKSKVFAGGVAKICRGGGGYCSQGVGCDDAPPPLSANMPTITKNTIQIPSAIFTELNKHDAIQAALLLALVDSDHRLIAGNSAGVLSIDMESGQRTHFEASAAFEGESAAGFKILFGSYEDALNASVSGQLLDGGRSGHLRITEAGRERTIGWQTQADGTRLWSR